MLERSTASAIAENDRVKRLARFALCALTLLSLAGSSGAQTKPRSTGKAASPAPANPYPERYAALCAVCHGANGRSDMPGTPVLAGQHSFYAITQLFLFREGRRSNEPMTAVAKTMSDADLRGFSEFIGTLPPVPAPAPATPPDAARMKKGRELAQLHKCLFCHGSDLSGGQQVPRIGGQREDYLQMTLQEFKSGKRPGYTMAMTEAVRQVTPEELDTLAYYVANFPGATPGGK